MRDRVISILDRLKAKGAEGLTGSIIDYREAGAHGFALQTGLSGKTFLKYEVGGDDEILRVEIMHGFASLDLTRSSDPVQFLTDLLQQNVPSFRSSGACLGLQKEKTGLIVLLASTHQFVATMSDDDIAEALSVAIFDLKSGMLMEFPEPIVTW